MATILIISPPNGDGTPLPSGGTTTPGGGTAVSGGGTPDRGGGTPFQPIPAEFNHCVDYYVQCLKIFNVTVIDAVFFPSNNIV